MSNLGPLIFLLVFVLPPVIQAIGKLREKAKAEQARQERIRARRESIRTGQAEPTVARAAETQKMPSRVETSVSAEDRLRQLERDRQARLRELRARASGSSRSTGRPSSQQTPASPSRPQQTRPVQRATAQQSPRQAPQPVRAPAARQRPKAAILQAPMPPRQTESQWIDKDAPKQSRQELRPSRLSPLDEKPAASRRGMTLKVNRESLRQAVILSELLRPPVSMRENA